MEALILLGSDETFPGPCFTGVLSLSLFLSVTIWVTSLGSVCEAPIFTELSVLPQYYRGPQMVHCGFADTRRLKTTHDSGYTMSYEVFRNIRLGFNGYWLQQLTDHQIDGASLANSKERTVGLGPGIQFGGRGIWFRVNSYLETDVRNRPSGIAVTFRISKALAADHGP